MKNLHVKLIFTFSMALSIFSCSKPLTADISEELLIGDHGFYAIDGNKSGSVEADPLRKKIGSLFLVEQFNTKVFESMKKAIAEHPPAGIVYWNPDNVGAEELFKVNLEYSNVAKSNGVLPLLLSTDYEGGGIRQNRLNKNISGIQRYTVGFSKLAHPTWLGAASPDDRDRLCFLHGKIMAAELKAVGINYPLATISDLGKNLFSIRGISKNPMIISECIKKMIDAFHAEKNMIFVTKHFPGLGDTVGDTHDQTVVSKAKTLDELKGSLYPFMDVINYVDKANKVENYSILASHAKYDVLDPDHITTVSNTILQKFLREQLNFKGIVISDAMWMGEYGHLKTQELLFVYLESILAGMDLLMISGKTFPPAVKFFRDIYDDRLNDFVKMQLTEKLKINWTDIRQKFIQRLAESNSRLEENRKSLVYVTETNSTSSSVQFVPPTEKTKIDYNEYLLTLKKYGLQYVE